MVEPPRVGPRSSWPTTPRKMSKRCVGDAGYAMAALLVGMSVMAIMLSMAMPVWRTAAMREREAELIFRGEQYAQAIDLFSRRLGGFPPTLEVLEKGRFIRKLYKDPVNGEDDFQPLYLGQVLPGQAPVPPGRGGPAAVPLGRAGQPPAAVGRGARVGQSSGAAPGQPGAVGAGPIIGVVSKSAAQSIRLYGGRGRYNEWAFVALAATQQAGAPVGAQNPGRGRGAGEPGVAGRGGVEGRGGIEGRAGRGRGEPAPGRGRGGRGASPPFRGNPFGLPGGLPTSGPGGQQPRRP